MVNILNRDFSPDHFRQLLDAGLSPVMARIFAARGIHNTQQIETDFSALLPFTQLHRAEEMALILADAIADKKRLLVVADYDSDGATACAVAVRALRQFGAVVDYLVPNRFEFGYGLTPEIVRIAAERQPHFLITVDNGIASHAGIEEAKKLGMEVLVTDHHLPADTLPEARCIVNPNQPECSFPSKNLAGVGVIFYVMLALRAELKKRDVFAQKEMPNLANLLDLVALGTVADVVKLDDNNRILVAQGLKRMRAGMTCAGIQALFRIASRDMRRVSPWDLGFALGPRLNAAGRLEDMSLGIELLTTENATLAMQLAGQLDQLNRQRREIEADMHDAALAALDNMEVAESYSLSLFDPDWHQGVIGILASRIKDKFHRPVIAFSAAGNGELKGSGRSIPGLHLRDALDLVSKHDPSLIRKFGGHAMAAGLTIAEENFEVFSQAFESVCQNLLTPAQLSRTIEIDGSLDVNDMSLNTAETMGGYVWGQGFPQPGFCDGFRVENQRIVGEKHLKLKLSREGKSFDAMLFFKNDPLPDSIRAVYRLDVNEYNGNRNLQLIVEHWEPDN